MKIHQLAMAACAMCLVSCSPKQAKTVEPEPTPAQSLINRLDSIQRAGLIAFGHDDDVAYGIGWQYVPDSSDVKAVVGDYPAIFNWDLGMIELQEPKNLDGVPFEFMRAEVVKHHNRGGINTFSWHPRNPASREDAWDGQIDSTLNVVLSDAALTDTLKAWIGHMADFVGSLRDDNGNLIPVVLRPWHEHTGNWFWWGASHCTPEQYKQLWTMTREIFDAKGLDNVVWAYSPDRQNAMTAETYLERYPGDEYVDILGTDIYYWGGEDMKPVFTDWVTTTLSMITEEAQKRGKLIALTETGLEGIAIPTWFSEYLYPAIKDYPVTYITVWRNAYDKPGHFFAPYPGHESAADFVEFYNLPKTAFLNDIKDIK